jgi:hypothetical protein
MAKLSDKIPAFEHRKDKVRARINKWYAREAKTGEAE